MYIIIGMSYPLRYLYIKIYKNSPEERKNIYHQFPYRMLCYGIREDFA